MEIKVSRKIAELLSLKESKQKKYEEILSKVDASFVKECGPQLGLSFRHEKYLSLNNGYEGCVYIYKYPHEVENNWLFTLTSIQDVIVVLDIASLNPSQIKKNLTNTMEENVGRYYAARSHSEAIDAQKQFTEAEEMYKEVAMFGNVMKTICLRIYIPSRNLVECDKKVADIIADLEGKGYLCGICINETKQDFRNVFLSHAMQMDSIYKRAGQGLLSTTLAKGNPFHYTKLSDPYGTFYGLTDTGGSVLLDLFRVTNRRTSYDSIIVGKKGSGKSTTMKKMCLDRACRGDMLRLFDVAYEYTELVKHLNGKIISLDGGENGIINMLQILRTSDNDKLSYNTHISKVATIYKYLKPDANSSEILVLKRLLRLLYIDRGIISSKGDMVRSLDSMRPEDFPRWSDFLVFINRTITITALRDELDNSEKMMEDIDTNLESDEEISSIFSDMRKSSQKYMESIELVVNDLCVSYGEIFDGYTSIQDFHNEQIVCFDIANLSKLESVIFDAQIFNALSLCWDNCVSVGREMKNLYDSRQIDPENIRHFLIMIDEAHRIVNTTKLAGIEQLMNFSREARKWFGGLVYASQSIRDFVPDGSDTVSIGELKKLFELTTYKWIMNQDSSCKSKLAEIFDGVFTESQLSRIQELEKGDVMLAIDGESGINMHVEISDEEERLFAGGM